jgi:pilus assembly protein CpaE
VCVLRAVVICPDREQAQRLEAALITHGAVEIVRQVHEYPTRSQLERMVRTHAPRILFLSVASLPEALEVAKAAEVYQPGLEVVAFHEASHPSLLLELMRAGVREFLAAPFSPETLNDILARVAERVRRAPLPLETTDLVLCFLPAKAGVGATTVAVNLSMALAAQPQTRVLLADFDLNCGIVGFMLKLDATYSVIDAVERAGRLDDSVWQQLVCSTANLDVLPAGRVEVGFRVEPAALLALLDFCRRHYKAICLDLSGNMEKHSLELMHESKWILLITTPELPALHLAREKLAFLRSLELDHRVKLVLNRAHKRMPVGIQEIERLLGHTVAATLPNDYAGVHKALEQGTHVDPSSELGRQFRAVARQFLPGLPDVGPPKRSFTEYFTLSPARRTVP